MLILNWLTRDSDIGAAKRVPYLLLEEAPELSAGDPNAGNMLIQGDNLEALKALLPFYTGQVKCIYIDPPCNTRSAFEHYDDNLEHAQWLAMMGFEEDEAKDAIEPAQGHLDETGLFAQRERPKPIFRHVVPATRELVSALQAAATTEGVSVTEPGDGKIEIAVTGRVAPEVETAIATAIPTSERQGFAEAVRKCRVEIKDRLSPAEQGEAFVVPRLVTEIQGTFEFADTDVFMEFHDWRLADHPARLDEGAFAIRETARSFEIDVDGNRVPDQFADEAEQLALDVDVDMRAQMLDKVGGVQ